MDRLLELLSDNDSIGGVAATTLAVIVVALVLRFVVAAIVRRRVGTDPYHRYWSGKIVTYVVAALALIALIAIWAPLGGRLSVILGFATAGIAFAMQEVIGALFGWVNVLAGRIYTVGDRVEVGGVRGDVVDITPLRTKLVEIGGAAGAEKGSTWVSARQPTGRIVTVSNKKTFTDPVYNFSAGLDWIWEELVLPIGQDADWRTAERILLEEVTRHRPQDRERGEAALARLGAGYALLSADVKPQTFIRIAGGDLEIVARFVVAVRSARTAKDQILRRTLERLQAEGIPLAYPTYGVTGEVQRV